MGNFFLFIHCLNLTDDCNKDEEMLPAARNQVIFNTISSPIYVIRNLFSIAIICSIPTFSWTFEWCEYGSFVQNAFCNRRLLAVYHKDSRKPSERQRELRFTCEFVSAMPTTSVWDGEWQCWSEMNSSFSTKDMHTWLHLSLNYQILIGRRHLLTSFDSSTSAVVLSLLADVIEAWMTFSQLLLNISKIQFLLVGSSQQLHNRFNCLLLFIWLDGELSLVLSYHIIWTSESYMF